MLIFTVTGSKEKESCVLFDALQKQNECERIQIAQRSLCRHFSVEPEFGLKEENEAIRKRSKSSEHLEKMNSWPFNAAVVLCCSLFFFFFFCNQRESTDKTSKALINNN